MTPPICIFFSEAIPPSPISVVPPVMEILPAAEMLLLLASPEEMISESFMARSPKMRRPLIFWSETDLTSESVISVEPLQKIPTSFVVTASTEESLITVLLSTNKAGQ